MKPLKIIVPLALIIAIFGGVCYGVSKSEEKKAEEEVVSYGAGEYFSFDSSTITELSLSVNGETYNLSIDDGGNWTFNDTGDRANYSNVSYAIDAMSSLNTTKRVEEDAQDLSRYGLDNPITISCSDGSEVYELQIGNPSPTGESYYIKSLEDNDVYTISSDDGSFLHLGKDDLKFRYITDSYVSAVRKLIYIQGDETVFHCEKLDGEQTWSLVEPTTNLTVNLASISNIADLLIRASIVDFISEEPTAEELRQYGLDDPSYTLEIADVDEDRTVYFGDILDGSKIYAQFADTEEVVTFYVSQLGIIGCGLDSILDKAIYTDDKKTISNVSILYNGVNTSIDITYDETERTYTYSKDGVVDTEDVLSFIADSTLNVVLYSVDFSVQPVGEPALTITFTHKEDPNVVTLKLIPTDETSSYYYVLFNDEYQGAIVSNRTLKSEGNLIYLLESYYS